MAYTLRPINSAPSSPAKPSLQIPKTTSDASRVANKIPQGDTPYVRAKNVQLVDKEPEKAIPLFWAAINAGDRVDSALKDMAIVMKQQNRAEEAIEAVKSLRGRCSSQAQESLDNILLDLYKRCGRVDDQISLLKYKLYMIQNGLAFNGRRTKTARSQGKKFQVSLEQEATRLLGNLGWALMQQNKYTEAESAYRQALHMAPDNNKTCNLGICLMKQCRVEEAKETLRKVTAVDCNVGGGGESHLKAFERAQQMLRDIECRASGVVYGCDIWQGEPCMEWCEEEGGCYEEEKKKKWKGDVVVTVIGESKCWNVNAVPFYGRTSMGERNNNNKVKRTRGGGGGGEVEDRWDGFLPEADGFEESIIASVIAEERGMEQKKFDKRLKVFEDIITVL